jgi:hypothetical protein
MENNLIDVPLASSDIYHREEVAWRLKPQLSKQNPPKRVKIQLLSPRGLRLSRGVYSTRTLSSTTATRRSFTSNQINSALISAGFTPPMRVAWPIVAG